MKKVGALMALVILVATSCSINRDIMFKTPTDFVFDEGADTLAHTFRMQPYDLFTFRLFTNDGFRMVDLVDIDGNMRQTQAMTRMVFSYFVDADGYAKMPMLGKVHLAGRTVREAEAYLEKLYSELYNAPFTQINVTNRRVIVFPGGGGTARVVPLENNNTTLMEALATVGGLSTRADARNIKLFRRTEGEKRKVYQFNMATIEGLPHADVLLQADDIIYVQPTPELARELLHDVAPFVTLLTSAVLVLGVIRGFR